MPCPMSESCELNRALRSSVIKRVRYPEVLPFCESGNGEGCALFAQLSVGRAVPRDLLPDGTRGDYMDDGRSDTYRFMVIEDSQVFAVLTSSALRTHFPGATVDCRGSFAEAEADLSTTSYSAVICGYGLGGEHTVHDVRRVSRVPIVVLTGRPGALDLPAGAQRVSKGAGPDALVEAVKAVTS